MTRILTASDYRRMPWKNRLGVTTEIARYPDEFGSLFDWRVSVADVMQDGPFSQFAGYDRIIIVIGGAGMELRHPEVEQPKDLGPFEPYSYPGEWETNCTLRSGPIRDMNVITRRGTAGGALSVIRGGMSKQEIVCRLLYCVSGEVTIFRKGTLHPEQTLLCDDETRLIATTSPDAVAIGVSIDVR